MQREIKFRGKRVDNGEWVYGCLCCIDNEPVIVEGSIKWVDGSKLYCNTFHFVIPESNGQYTGLKDKNGKEIYEGDIVKAESHNPSNYLIEFIEGGFCCTHPKLTGYPIDINHFYTSLGCLFEVVGNIYENPELLEK